MIIFAIFLAIIFSLIVYIVSIYNNIVTLFNTFSQIYV